MTMIVSHAEKNQVLKFYEKLNEDSLWTKQNEVPPNYLVLKAKHNKVNKNKDWNHRDELATCKVHGLRHWNVWRDAGVVQFVYLFITRTTHYNYHYNEEWEGQINLFFIKNIETERIGTKQVSGLGQQIQFSAL